MKNKKESELSAVGGTDAKRQKDKESPKGKMKSIMPFPRSWKSICMRVAFLPKMNIFKSKMIMLIVIFTKRSMGHFVKIC